eukprot:g3809.t1
MSLRRPRIARKLKEGPLNVRKSSKWWRTRGWKQRHLQLVRFGYGQTSLKLLHRDGKQVVKDELRVEGDWVVELHVKPPHSFSVTSPAGVLARSPGDVARTPRADRGFKLELCAHGALQQHSWVEALRQAVREAASTGPGARRKVSAPRPSYAESSHDSAHANGALEDALQQDDNPSSPASPASPAPAARPAPAAPPARWASSSLAAAAGGVSPARCYIDVELHVLKGLLGRRLPKAEEQQEWDSFVQIQGALCHHSHHETCVRLKQQYAHFAAAAGGGRAGGGTGGVAGDAGGAQSRRASATMGHAWSNLRPASSRAFSHGRAGAAQRLKLEQAFLTTLAGVIQSAGFRMMSNAEWGAATSADFSFVMPVEVEWGRLDQHMLPRFLASLSNTAAEEAAFFSDRILVFHRGVAQAEMRDRAIAAKIDLLLARAVVAPVARVWRAAARALPALRALHETCGGGALHATELAWTKIEQAARAGAGAAVPWGRAGAPAALPAVAPGRPARRRSSLQGGMAVARNTSRGPPVRQTLEDECPSIGALLGALPRRVHLLEPCFKEVVVLYRDAHTAPRAGAGAGAGAGGAGPPAPGPICVRRFLSVPMADAELVFPHTQVYAPTQQVVTLVVTTLVALAAVAKAWFEAHAAGGLSAGLGAMASILAARVAAMYTALNDSKQRVRSQMVDSLYDKLDSSNRGVLLSLTNSMEEQEQKEVLVAYWVLLHSKRALTRAELAGEGARLLRAKCNVHTEYDVPQSVLDQMVADGVVRRGADGGYTANPIGACNRSLDEKWDALYDYDF